MARMDNGKWGMGTGMNRGWEEWEMEKMDRMGTGRSRGWEEWTMGRMGRMGHAKNGKWDKWEESKE